MGDEPRPPEPSSAPDPLAPRVRATVDHWKRRLLDLSKRNRLLNFKPTPVSTIVITGEEPAHVFRRLWLDEKPMKFKALHADRPRPSDAGLEDGGAVNGELWSEPGEPTVEDTAVEFEPYQAARPDDRHSDDVLQTASTREQLDRSLRRLADQARLTQEEQGINTLFLALGMLTYRESRDSEETFRAPLVLLPVSLTRTSARAAYLLSTSDDDPLVNPALAEHLRHTHGVVIPDLPDADTMAEDYDLGIWLRALAEKIPEQTGWRVERNIYLGLFSFQKFVMYKDLEQNAPRFEGHRLVRQLVARSGPFVGLPDDVRSLDLDAECAPERTFQVVDADSSQIRAMAAVLRGYDLVVEGPPGTGKSQTITNLIAQALAAGKTVLFVAEKMAALDVVHRRLVAAGLGESCLEVHSSKANKRAVIHQIREALDASLQRAPASAVPTGRLRQVREELTAYVAAVHAPHGALGISPYRAYGDLGAVLDAPKVRWTGQASVVTAEALAQTERELHDLVAAANNIGDPRLHPWRDTGRTFYAEADLDELRELLAMLRDLLGELSATAPEVAREFGLPPISTLTAVATAVEVAGLLARSPGAPVDVLHSEAWNSPPAEAQDLIRAARQVAELRRHALTCFVPDVFALDHGADVAYVEQKSQGLLGWLAFSDGRYRAIRRRWVNYRLPTYRRTLLEQATELRAVDRYRQEQAALVAREATARALFGALWRGEASDCDLLTRYVGWVVEFRSACIRHRLASPALQHAARGPVDVARIRALETAARRAADALERLRQTVGWPESYFDDAEFATLRERVTALLDHLHLAPGWAAFETVRVRAESGLAQEPVRAVMAGEITFADLPRAFRRAFLQRWIGEVIEARPALRAFQTVPHERRLEEFRALDRAVLDANRAVLLRDLRDKVQDRLKTDDATAAMPFLRREMARQRGLSPLRKTVSHAHAAIRAIKPCFLMSPLTVAQLLPASALPFDLVIFDEASQLPAEDAAGAILRGGQLAVVGDPKQLPPTNFFAVMNGFVTAPLDEDGTPIYEDSESVLEEFMAAGFPMSRLKWHYRSTHESLITFSNASFYDAQLYTFPSVESAGSLDGLQFQHVEGGVYEGKGLNLVEARRVADAVVLHARTSPHLSLGVGTFNLRQQLAIQDELELRRRHDPGLEAFFASGPEPFFVKNLENIQGDERDVIFISVTYAKGPDGRLRYNFGPLNTQNGWRRLNVLITRARKRMRVFASMRGEDISPAATTTEGPRLLRDFLVFAEHRRLDSPVLARAAETESPFERDVHVELTRRGVQLVPQVGLAGYRIDFGVQDDTVPGRFVCGIECDGVAYHSAETARDRDRLRQEVLEGRGWSIYRVWSTDWFKDRHGQIERLLRLIEEAKRRARDEASARAEVMSPGSPEDDRRATEESDDFVALASSDGYVRPVASPYRVAPGAGTYSGRDILLEAAASVRRAVEAVVAAEGPLHIDDLFNRVAAIWGVRLGSRIEARIRAACRSAERTGSVSVRGQFLWPATGAVKVRSRAATGIPAERIPPEEFREAVLMVLRAGASLARAQLIQEARAVLGFARTGPALESALTAAIDELLRAGTIGQGSRGLVLRADPDSGEG